MGLTPTQEASYALNYKLGRDGLSTAGQLEYDRLLAERIAAAKGSQPTAGSAPPETPSSARSSPEVRARILEMFKRSNSKYSKPFEKDRLAAVSLFGGDWEEYGQIVLQMAILETLLSIEELLQPPHDAAPDI